MAREPGSDQPWTHVDGAQRTTVGAGLLLAMTLPILAWLARIFVKSNCVEHAIYPGHSEAPRKMISLRA